MKTLLLMLSLLPAVDAGSGRGSESISGNLRLDLESVEVAASPAAKPILTLSIENVGATVLFLDLSGFGEVISVKYDHKGFFSGVARQRQTDHDARLCVPEGKVAEVQPGKAFKRTILLKEAIRPGPAFVSVRLTVPASLTKELCKEWPEQVLRNEKKVTVIRRSSSESKDSIP